MGNLDMAQICSIIFSNHSMYLSKLHLHMRPTFLVVETVITPKSSSHNSKFSILNSNRKGHGLLVLSVRIITGAKAWFKIGTLRFIKTFASKPDPKLGHINDQASVYTADSTLGVTRPISLLRHACLRRGRQYLSGVIILSPNDIRSTPNIK